MLKKSSRNIKTEPINDTDTEIQKKEACQNSKDLQIIRIISPLIAMLISLVAFLSVLFLKDEYTQFKLLPYIMALSAMSMLIFLSSNLNEIKKEEKLSNSTTLNYNVLSDLMSEISCLKASIRSLKNPETSLSAQEKRLRLFLIRIKRTFTEMEAKFTSLQYECDYRKRDSFWGFLIFAVIGLIPFIIMIVRSFDSGSVNQLSEGADSALQIVSSKWPYAALTLICEFTAGLFLKMFFRWMEESKHYTRESIALAKNMIALETTIYLDLKESTQDIVQKMLNPKENRILKEGEITEQYLHEKKNAEIESTLLKQLMNSISLSPKKE